MTWPRLAERFFLGTVLLLPAACSQRDCCAPPVLAVASVTVTPASRTLTVADTVRLTATVKDAAGNVLTGSAVTGRAATRPSRWCPQRGS